MTTKTSVMRRKPRACFQIFCLKDSSGFCRGKAPSGTKTQSVLLRTDLDALSFRTSSKELAALKAKIWLRNFIRCAQHRRAKLPMLFDAHCRTFNWGNQCRWIFDVAIANAARKTCDRTTHKSKRPRLKVALHYSTLWSTKRLVFMLSSLNCPKRPTLTTTWLEQCRVSTGCR